MIVGAGLASALLLTRIIHKNLEMLPVLYCEWFLPVFTVDGVPDSDEGILRSSDRILLPILKMPGHFPWGSTDLHHNWQIQTASHSTIVVDRGNQSGMKDYFKGHYMPHASQQIFYDDGEHAASTVAYNDRMYPGVRVWRAISVLDGAYLVVDVILSDEEHIYNRWFHGVPDESNALKGINLDMKPRPEPLGDMVVIDGKPYEVILNPDGTEVKTCKGVTRKVLSVVAKRKEF
ncbi:hypothetical protein ES707_06808 [subsurface metagenome]